MLKQYPASSYRLQLSDSFTLHDATALIPYLKSLGIEMVYTSPCFEIVKGSCNPYMVLSPHKIAMHLGGEKAFVEFCMTCQKHGMMHMMDIVPNHMAASKENPWWKDVLEKGQDSKFAHFFDIDWERCEHIVPLDVEGNIHEKINYRRFFDICDMVGLNIHHDDVYEEYFKKVAEFVEKVYVQGFRVDHIYGLKRPKAFLDRLHKDFPTTLVYLEKILQDGELLRPDWKADGSVGYDCLFLFDQVLLARRGEKAFTSLYLQYAEENPVDLPKIKVSYLNKYLISEVNRFAKWFNIEKKELTSFLSYFPNYRSYVTEEEVDELDKEAIQQAAKQAGSSFFLEKVFEKLYRNSFMKLQQILPAVFAKGFEDTFNYRYLRFTSLNEVGGKPLLFGLSNEEFHKKVKNLAEKWPYTMHTLSTHDTKRSLDARMRLHTLAEIPQRSVHSIKKWMSVLPAFSSDTTRYFFLQSLLAMSEEDRTERITAYMIKSLREGKYHSDHLTPNLAFEKELTSWIRSALACEEFLVDFTAFKKEIEEAARVKSSAALVLQVGMPGVMDIYQGEELDSANLVDPDNRRPVDFALRQSLLHTPQEPLKMLVLRKGLHFRRMYRDLVLQGEYEPLPSEEGRIAFTRRYKKHAMTVQVNKYHIGDLSLPPPQVPPGEIDIFTEENRTSFPFSISIKA
jgi:(1->4)-alpha-D-glucan 1-alpha-D-glucosylmutase